MIDRRQFSIVIIAFRLFFACYAAVSTELVEEWGCYDSEFKLTCNDIDSHVGILEATFTPHCDGNQNCLFYDEDSIMKFISKTLSRKAETHEEEFFARKLLEALRKSREREREKQENEAKTSEFRSELPLTSTDIIDATTISESAETLAGDYDMLFRSDKKMLRESLERLINLYLTKLREDSVEYNVFEDTQEHGRKKRELVMARVVNRRKNLIPGKCKTMRRRIGVLDRIEIEHAIRNFSNTEFNIRKLLNYRCSGKNHCSFIFSSDHPYGAFWDEGEVHIKYICMENFRVNKYCGELLQIGNEDWDLRRNLNWSEVANANKNNEMNDDDGSGGGPKTSALRSNDMNYYQVANLKIIKADNNETNSMRASLPQAKNSSEIKLTVTRQNEGGKDKPRNKVYSQDFLKFKVLPNIVEKPEPDIIDKLKKEEYIFHRKQEDETATVIGIESNEIDSILLTTLRPSSTAGLGVASNPPTMAAEIDIFSTLISSSAGDDQTTISKETKDYEKTVIPTMFANYTEYDESNEVISNEAHSKNFDSPEKTKYGDEDIDIEQNSEDTDDYDDESFEREDKERMRIRQNHKSHQHTLPSSTLLHGFISNPGYPSYYIGNDYECKWKVRMAKGQRMTLTILDLHLRIDEFCKDSLEIIDIGDYNRKQSLWRGCSELTRLKQVQSLSHQVEIVLKTRSKNIFPKRGFLIHYKAIGCVDPPLPANVKLVSRSENILKYSCSETEHVFPDSTLSDKTITCNGEAWNETLPECVAIHETYDRQINLINNEKYRAGKMTADNEGLTDILVPVCIIAGLFLLNAIVFIIILRYRRQRRDDTNSLDRELADL